jgi:polyisoprenoid-binding protein YceI
MKKLIKYSLITSIMIGSLYAGTYKVDTSHSEVGFKVKHMMVSNVKGKFDKFEGEFEFDEEKKELKSIKGNIKVDSVNTGNEKRDKHLKEQDFFDTEKYKEMSFESTKIEKDKVYGYLKLKDVKQLIELNIEESGKVIKDPWGKTRTGFSLKGEIKRSDFGLKYNSVLETGGVTVGDTVKLEIEIEGIKEEN